MSLNFVAKKAAQDVLLLRCKPGHP